MRYTINMTTTTVENNVSVIHQGAPRVVGAVTLIPEILNLNGEAHARLLYGTGQEIVIPASLLAALGSQEATQLRALLVRDLDLLRRDFAGDPSGYGLVAAAGTPGQRFGGVAGHPLTLPGAADYTADGTPVIEWMHGGDYRSDSTIGWRLYLAGAKTATIGFAKWDDRDALGNLAAMMHDTESMLTMAAIMHPKPISELSARLAARALRDARGLPGIDLKKVRAILTDAGLARTEDQGEGYLRLLTIESGGKAVPIAAAIAAPTIRTRPFTAVESELSYKEKETLRRRLIAEGLAPWYVKAQQVLADAGWRTIDLPSSSSSLGRHYGQPILHATRIDSDTWSSIAAAAAVRARDLDMARGARF